MPLIYPTSGLGTARILSAYCDAIRDHVVQLGSVLFVAHDSVAAIALTSVAAHENSWGCVFLYDGARPASRVAPGAAYVAEHEFSLIVARPNLAEADYQNMILGESATNPDKGVVAIADDLRAYVEALRFPEGVLKKNDCAEWTGTEPYSVPTGEILPAMRIRFMYTQINNQEPNSVFVQMA